MNAGDAGTMRSVLTRLLDNDYYAGPQQKQFLLTTLLATLIKTNDNERARQLWDEQLVNFMRKAISLLKYRFYWQKSGIYNKFDAYIQQQLVNIRTLPLPVAE